MSAPIKILQLLSEAGYGGTEQVVYDVVTHMDRTGFDIELYFVRDPGPLGERYKGEGFRVTYLHWRLWKTPTTLFKLYRLLRRGHYQIVHSYGFKANLMARIVGRLAGAPKIISGLHSQYPSVKRNRFLFWLDRLTLPLTTCYVAVSRAAVDYLMTAEGYTAHKFRVIYNGIDPTPFASLSIDRGLLRRRYGLPDGEIPTIVCVAHFRPGKGQETLLAALALLQVRNYLCLLVGDGSQRSSVEALSRKLKLYDRVRFMGTRHHEEIIEILRVADLFVLPSYWEGMPVAIMEAMAAGLPVIVTDVGGTRELVVEGETGFLVPPADPESLADRIRRLLDDPELRQHLGACGRERVRQEFSLDRTVRAYEALYEELTRQ